MFCERTVQVPSIKDSIVKDSFRNKESWPLIIDAPKIVRVASISASIKVMDVSSFWTSRVRL